MNLRTRVLLVAVIVVVAMTGAVGYVIAARHGQTAATADAPPLDTRDDLASVAAGPHLVFRNTALGPAYGRVALVPLAETGGPRAVSTATCERVFAVSGSALCLEAYRGLVTTYRSQVLGRDWSATATLPLTGLPSRARLSQDGTLAATTTFVYGDSYANPGQFSTRTLVSRVDGSSSVDLEQFALIIDGVSTTAADRNIWGVTFLDADTFYATAATAGRTWLVRGSLAGRSLTAVRPDVECPSLSPDHRRIAFKKHGNLPAGQWRLAVYDLATGAETMLAETHSIDDQVVWLDDQTIIYGLPRNTAGTASSDIWAVAADGSGTPRVLVADAWSPSIVR